MKNEELKTNITKMINDNITQTESDFIYTWVTTYFKKVHKKIGYNDYTPDDDVDLWIFFNKNIKKYDGNKSGPTTWTYNLFRLFILYKKRKKYKEYNLICDDSLLIYADSDNNISIQDEIDLDIFDKIFKKKNIKTKKDKKEVYARYI
jgi:hypothetical protein